MTVPDASVPSGDEQFPDCGAGRAVNSASAVALLLPWVHVTLTVAVVPAATSRATMRADPASGATEADPAVHVAVGGVTSKPADTVTVAAPGSGVPEAPARPLMVTVAVSGWQCGGVVVAGGVRNAQQTVAAAARAARDLSMTSGVWARLTKIAS